MALPAEYEREVVNQAVAQATSKTDSEFVQNEIEIPREESNTKIYLPDDEELRKKVIDAREDLKNLRQYSIKNNFNSFQTNQLVDELLNDYGLTKEQVAGIYQSNGENLYKSFTNGFNQRLAGLLQSGSDFLPYINWTASDIDEYLSQEEEYRQNIKDSI